MQEAQIEPVEMPPACNPIHPIQPPGDQPLLGAVGGAGVQPGAGNLPSPPPLDRARTEKEKIRRKKLKKENELLKEVLKEKRERKKRRKENK